MSSGGQQPSAPQTPFSPNYRERRSVQSRGPGNAYTQRPGQQPNPQQPAQQLPPPPQQGNMQYDGGGYSTPFGGYGGFFEQYRTPFSGYGGGYGGGFSQPFALPQNPYNPYGSQQFNRQPPPGMEVNPNYQPSNRLSQDVRPSDMQFRLQGEDTPKNPEPAPSSYGSTEMYKAISDSSMNRFVPDERQLGPAIQPNPGFRGNFSDYGDAMRNQGIGFGNPYGGYGAPYGGSPYMGMFGGLGSLFGGNGFQGMNQQARAQMDLMDSRRSGFDRIGTFVPQQNQANQQAKLLAAQQGQQPSVETDAEFNQRIAQKESEYYADMERLFGKDRADQIRKSGHDGKGPINFAAGSTRGATGNMGSFDYRSYIG